jgi:hypothetical protein
MMQRRSPIWQDPMTNKASDVSGASPSEPVHPLADRVRARVAEVGLALEKRTRASRPRAKNARAPRPGSGASQTQGHSPEARSLRRVFNELAITHRQHRQRSGQRVSSGLKDAARAFKEGPNLPNLVVVASFLDEDGLLAW